MQTSRCRKKSEKYKWMTITKKPRTQQKKNTHEQRIHIPLIIQNLQNHFDGNVLDKMLVFLDENEQISKSHLVIYIYTHLFTFSTFVIIFFVVCVCVFFSLLSCHFFYHTLSLALTLCCACVSCASDMCVCVCVCILYKIDTQTLLYLLNANICILFFSVPLFQ